MLTKTLKFEDDVLEVLKAMQWSDDGLRGALVGQLDRRLYERTNKALEAMGGKWNRKAGGHTFAADPRGQVEGLLTNGTLTVERDGFFETPERVVLQMLELCPLPDRPCEILEPSAGRGAILRVLKSRAAGHSYTIIEKNQQRREYLESCFTGVQDVDDFLAFYPIFGFDRIYMNPPFEELQDIDHVQHAYNLLDEEGMMVSVMSESPFFRNDTKSKNFREWLELVGGYSEKLPEGSFEESGAGVNCRLVVISGA